MGRETLLTPELTAQVVAALEAGCTHKTACEAAGIGERTFYRWMRQGKNDQDSDQWQFRQAIKKAAGKAKLEHVKAIRIAGETSWQAHAWLLERTAPDEYGSQRREIRELKKELAELMKIVKGNFQPHNRKLP